MPIIVAAEAALSLQTAADQFLNLHGQHQQIFGPGHVALKSSCEIDKNCRTVLSQTLGPYTDGTHCLFPDIMELDRQKGKAFCLTHKKMCFFKAARPYRRISPK